MTPKSNVKKSTPKDNENKNNKPFVVHMTLPFLLLGVVIPTFLAYTCGLAFRTYVYEPRLARVTTTTMKPDDDVVVKPATAPSTPSSSSSSSSSVCEEKQHNEDANAGKAELPRPFLPKGKVPPDVLYSGQNMVGGHASVRNSHDVHIIYGDQDEEEATTEPTCSRQNDNNDHDEEEEHLPAGQHLLVDLEGVSASFLDDEVALAKAMVDTASHSGLTLLSYHCHALTPKGVSCVGVLLESHISFHTWPDEGVITLDLFTCGSGELVPVLPLVEKLFSVVDEEGVEENKPTMVWSHVLRGFRPPPEDGKKRVLENEIANVVLRRLDLDVKKEIYSVTTGYQKIDIFDVAGVLTNERGLRKSTKELKGSSKRTAQHHAPPNRMFFLDGFLQSTSYGDSAYHEALVHPAMFAHPSPSRIAILGAGDGAVLREVLKHETVEEVKLLDMDKDMVHAARTYLPQWNNCSDFIGRADCCFDDETTELVYEDALQWFVDWFGDEEEDDYHDNEDENEDEEDPFDIVIMNAIDLQNSYEFSKVEHNIESFLKSVYESLNDNGILAMQLGFSPSIMDPAEDMSVNSNRARVMSMIERFGFESIHVYEESHGGLHKPSSFLVACKSYGCRWYWQGSEAMIQVSSQYRIVKTHSKEFPLKHFDGATMKSYQIPPKSWETMFCRQNPVPYQCTRYRHDPKIKNFRRNNFEVKTSSIGDGAGRGAFAKVDIPKGSFIIQEELSKKIYFSHETTYKMDEMYYRKETDFGELSKVLNYMHGYGFESKVVAPTEYYVDAGILTFVNHGCNGTNNIRDGRAIEPDSPYFSETTVDPQKHPVPDGHEISPFDPLVDRHLSQIAVGYIVAIRDIKAGEELLQNYLFFSQSDTEIEWEAYVQNIKDQCAGKKLGLIKEVEEKNNLSGI